MATTAEAAIAGMRILMVEDEMMLAMSLEDLLELLECSVVKAPNVKRALELIESETVDGALLDVNLGGKRVYPVAAELARRETPFVFMTGYDSEHVSEQWRDRPVLRKPFTLEALETAIATFGRP